MTRCKKVAFEIKQIPDDRMAEIKDKLAIEDLKRSILALAFDGDGHIAVMASDKEFNFSPEPLPVEKPGNGTPTHFMANQSPSTASITIQGSSITIDWGNLF